MAPQHRRGGKHAVKDEDLTHTKYDDYNREQLLAAVKEVGCYVKDDKKSVMARKLAEHDRNLQNQERRAVLQQKEREKARQQEIKDAAKAREGRRTARAKRNEERGMRRERGEEVSSNSDDTDEEQDRCNAHKLTITGGEALSDETWQDTCSETTIRSKNPPVYPGCRLRLFEWPYPNSPLHGPSPDLQFEQHPAALAYAPLKLVTTNTNEKATLPGQKYPAGVDPDFVPILDPLTRSAARHGHMLGPLARATIEPASSWANCTTVQGWNGRMYFSLPAQHDAKNTRLDTVYRKWDIENTKLLQPTPGVTDVKTDRKGRFAQRLANKRKAVSEVYKVSKWKPLALGYMPAYLDWEAGVQCASDEHVERTLGNLFYVCFPGCDVPHYYFWSREGGWSDPTTPDPSWSPEGLARHGRVETVADGYNVLLSKKFRVKKLTAPPTLKSASAQTDESHLTVPFVEIDLVKHGLSSTLAKYRSLAFRAGKEHAWSVFTGQLPQQYPSGELPHAPPALAEGMCIAEKITALLSGREATPYSGQEGWTRNDDEFWDIVSCTEHEDVLMSDTHSSAKSQDPHTANADDERTEALHRRDSMDILPSPSEKRIWAWLDSISPNCTPIIAPLSSLPISIKEPPISPPSLYTRETSPTCPFCSLPWAYLPSWEQASHMLSHSHISPFPSTSTSHITANGVGVKRRHSLLSHRTLQSYHGRCGQGRKTVGLDSAASLAGGILEGVGKGIKRVGRERSPFSKEVKRARDMRRVSGEGRGGRGWVLERRMSGGWANEHWAEMNGDELDGERGDEESVWFGDDEG